MFGVLLASASLIHQPRSCLTLRVLTPLHSAANFVMTGRALHLCNAPLV
jgi:hypothetical protein